MDLLTKIRESNFLVTFTGVKDENIEVCQKRLCAAGAAPMPLSYAGLLKETNGIFGGDVSVFGIDAPQPCEDVYAKNTVAGIKNKPLVFLGMSLTEYLCYDWHKKSYVILNKEDNGETMASPLLPAVLATFLQNYI